MLLIALYQLDFPYEFTHSVAQRELLFFSSRNVRDDFMALLVPYFLFHN
jgi:hypothetical protein